MGRIKEIIKRSIFNKAYILSDSHGQFLKHINFRVLLLIPEFYIVPGATASGLANPNSKTQARNIFLNVIEKIKRKDFVFFELGEVDCGFTLWFLHEKKKIPIEQLFDRAIKNYSDIILKAKEKTNRIVVFSAILPTIKDGVTFGPVANFRKDIKASQKQRTDLTLRFNQEIKKFCRQNNITFIDLDKKMLDKKTGLIKDYYLNDDPSDHHTNPIKTSKVIKKELFFKVLYLKIFK